MSLLVHATCVVLGGAGVLLLGPSASGKSDLALRLIDGGAWLVADDQVQLDAIDDALIASAPPNLPRQLEVRGVGLMRVPMAQHVPVTLAIDLDPAATRERLPAPAQWEALGLAIPLIRLDAFSASAAAKVRLAAAAALVQSRQPHSRTA